MTNNIKALRFLLLLAIIFTTPLSTATQEKTIGEDTLKALYSYKFALFTEWPAAKLNANDGLRFCIAGKNSFSPTALTSIEGKLVKEKSLYIEVFENGLLSEESLDSCFILFVSSSETQRFPTILNAIRQLPILTISDIQGFSNHNGMITLVKSGDHIQFEINPDAIRQAGLSISSKIIELATTLVKTKKDGGNQ